MKLLALIILLVTLQPALAKACTLQGAYGIHFGDKPDRKAKRIRGGKASTYYSVIPPNPDSRFDTYEVRVDTKTKRIFEIDAIKTIIPMAQAEGLTEQQRLQGQQRARDFAMEYYASLPEAVRAKLEDKYDTLNWQGSIEDGLWFEMLVNFSWSVDIQCVDIAGENVMGRRVLPEMYSK